MGYEIPLIHIVDDDDAMRDSLQLLLESHDIETQCWGSAEEFLQADQSGMRCLVLDLHMPGMSGLELLRMLRSRDPSMPIIIVSGGLVEGVKADARQAGATAILSKPYEAQELLELVREALAA